MAGLQVAELLENGKLVGVVRGCIKGVATGFGEAHVKIGCILGLRVSPTHRYYSRFPPTQQKSQGSMFLF